MGSDENRKEVRAMFSKYLINEKENVKRKKIQLKTK